jgi:adenylate cyclase
VILRVSGQTVREVELTKFPFIIGRDPRCDLTVNQPVLSRQHCQIEASGNRYSIRDLGSTNGTTIKGTPVTTREIAAGDVIRIGEVEIAFFPDSMADSGAQRIGPEKASSVEDLMQQYSLHTPAEQSMASMAKAEGEEKEYRMFYLLYQMSKGLSLVMDVDELLRKSIEWIFNAMSADRGVLFLRTPSGDLVPRLAYSARDKFIDPQTVRVSHSVLRRATEERQAIFSSDTLADSKLSDQLSIVQQKIRSVLCAPLWVDKDIYGAIYLDATSKADTLTDKDRALLTGITNLIAIRLRQDRLVETLLREERLREKLSRYHSPDVVELLAQGGGTLETGRREVTVMFADIRDSTTLAERLGEDEVHKLLHQFYEMGADAVFRHKGHLNKFIGDALLAVFNAPVKVEGHEASAVEAARDILKGLRQFNEKNPKWAFRLRIGINTGRVIAGDIGPENRKEYTVIGDAVNVAERLCKIESGSGLVVSEETWKRLDGKYAGKDLGEVTVKGRERPLRISEVEV